MIRQLLFTTPIGDRCLAALERCTGLAMVGVDQAASQRVGHPVLYGRCPTCGAVGPMIYVGLQETDDGKAPIPLANCSACGSTVRPRPPANGGAPCR